MLKSGYPSAAIYHSLAAGYPPLTFFWAEKKTKKAKFP